MHIPIIDIIMKIPLNIPSIPLYIYIWLVDFI